VQTVAGHDSTNMKDKVPTVMLFVPSVGGVSHNEKEYTRDQDAAAGADLLEEVLRRLAEGELATSGVTLGAGYSHGRVVTTAEMEGA